MADVQGSLQLALAARPCQVIHSSNLCTEVLLTVAAKRETAVCNLGSVILDTHIETTARSILKLFEKQSRRGERSITSSTSTSTRPKRPDEPTCVTGPSAGVMGLQNALFKKGIGFADPEAIEFNDEFMEAVAYCAYKCLQRIGRRGAGPTRATAGPNGIAVCFPGYHRDPRKERGIKIDVPRGGRPRGIRFRTESGNMACATPTSSPSLTATISNITGTTPCIEARTTRTFTSNRICPEISLFSIAS